MRRFVLYLPEWGVYLDNAMGLGFWSKEDPVGQTHACTFASEVAIAHAATGPDAGVVRKLMTHEEIRSRLLMRLNRDERERLRSALEAARAAAWQRAAEMAISAAENDGGDGPDEYDLPSKYVTGRTVRCQRLSLSVRRMFEHLRGYDATVDRILNILFDLRGEP